MSYMTDETMDEFAQWQHDSAWEFQNDEFEIRPGDMMEDCPHENANVTVYDSGDERIRVEYFRVWECPECGNIGECGKEF